MPGELTIGNERLLVCFNCVWEDLLLASNLLLLCHPPRWQVIYGLKVYLRLVIIAFGCFSIHRLCVCVFLGKIAKIVFSPSE